MNEHKAAVSNPDLACKALRDVLADKDQPGEIKVYAAEKLLEHEKNMLAFAMAQQAYEDGIEEGMTFELAHEVGEVEEDDEVVVMQPWHNVAIVDLFVFLCKLVLAAIPVSFFVGFGYVLFMLVLQYLAILFL